MEGTLPGRRGIGLAGTIVVTLVVFVLAFTLAAVSTLHLNLAVHSGNQKRALNLAESAVARAIAELVRDPQFGKPGRAGYDTVLEWPPAAGEDEVGRLTFNPDIPGIPPSLNNLNVDSPVPGYGGTVPKDCAQLVAVGRYRGVARRLEVLVHVPPFEHVLGSSGPVTTRGNVLVGTVPNAASLSTLAPEDVLPGGMASNSALDPAISLDGETLVKGDVRSAGGIAINATSAVEGQVWPYGEAAGLPRLSVPSYDTSGKPGVETVSGPLSEATLSGYQMAPDGLAASGGLTLDGCVLYVKGDLNVSGGLKGTGAVLVTGSARLRGGATLAADNLVALGCQGNLSLLGEGRSSYFRGLLYSEGDVDVGDITLIGTLVANRPGPGGSRVEVQDAAIVGGVEEIEFEVKMRRPADGTLDLTVIDPATGRIQVVDAAAQWRWDEPEGEDFRLGGIKFAVDNDGDLNRIDPETEIGVKIAPVRDIAIQVAARKEPYPIYDTDGTLLAVADGKVEAGSGQDQDGNPIDGTIRLELTRGGETYRFKSAGAWTLNKKVGFKNLFLEKADVSLGSDGGLQVGWDSEDPLVRRKGESFKFFDLAGNVLGNAQPYELRDPFNGALVATFDYQFSSQLVAGQVAPRPKPERFRFNFNEFLSLQDRMRILLWREIP